MRKARAERTYELVVVFVPGCEGDKELAEELDKIKARVAQGNGSVVKEDIWGKRQLALSLIHI